MSHRREYEIAFVGLKPGIHVYEYRVDDKFFAPYGKQDFSNCDANIKLSLDKKNGFMQLRFDIDGAVEATCDRCGNPLHLQLWDEFNIIVKMVDEPDTMNEQEDDPDVYYISRGESHLYLSGWIYEFINLSIPLQKICGEDEKGKSKCNPEVLEKLKQMEEGTKKDDKNTVWKGLDQFKNLE
ncbi:MAG: DUF177 domain-containing protein [Sediminibacterium magnilacihabitans]|jgi:uncharacterized metal-binding protein YceD (DUF177 family)|nr:DUF177 domain-containing protein [Sediminibacterium magnilacihabitans]PQV62326.1 uncharacterized metal-binding protein YceD (DUF177 family) [Sediminibacterium magnilacihabitans]